jgi:hypothetical protein
MSKKWIILFVCTLPFMLVAQTPTDSLQIKEAVLNYALGWFEGKPDLMEKALYHDFGKRNISVDEKGKTRISGHTAMSMVQGTRKRAENPIPHEEAVKKIKEVGISQIYDNIASAYVKSDSWIDFILLAKIDGEWKMMNVVWQRPLTE